MERGKDVEGEEENQERVEKGNRDIASIGKKKVAPTCIMNFMRTSGKEKSKLGLKQIRMKKLHDIDDRMKHVLVRILRNILVKVTESFLPNDTKALLSEAVEADGVERHHDAIFLKELRCARKASLKKRLLRCVAVGNMKRTDAPRVIRSDVQGLELDDGLGPEPSGESGIEGVKDGSGSKDFSGNIRRLYHRSINDWV